MAWSGESQCRGREREAIDVDERGATRFALNAVLEVVAF